MKNKQSAAYREFLSSGKQMKGQVKSSAPIKFKGISSAGSKRQLQEQIIEKIGKPQKKTVKLEIYKDKNQYVNKQSYQDHYSAENLLEDYKKEIERLQKENQDCKQRLEESRKMSQKYLEQRQWIQQILPQNQNIKKLLKEIQSENKMLRKRNEELQRENQQLKKRNSNQNSPIISKNKIEGKKKLEVTQDFNPLPVTKKKNSSPLEKKSKTESPIKLNRIKKQPSSKSNKPQYEVQIQKAEQLLSKQNLSAQKCSNAQQLLNSAKDSLQAIPEKDGQCLQTLTYLYTLVINLKYRQLEPKAKIQPFFRAALNFYNSKEEVYFEEKIVLLNNFALYLQKNDVDEAIKLYQQVLRIQEKYYSSKDERNALTYNNIACILCQTQRQNRGKQWFFKALQMASKESKIGKLIRENYDVYFPKEKKAANYDLWKQSSKK